MAETEDSKASEVATTEELGMSSYQDPNKSDYCGTSHNNQAKDLENSYVVVVEADGLNDFVDFNKNVVAESPSVLSESITMVDEQGIELDSQNEKLDIVDGEVREPMDWDENGYLMRFGEFPCLISCRTMKHVSSLEDGNKFQVSFTNSLEIEEVNNDDESRVVLEAEDVEDVGDQLDTATGCCKENLFQTENVPTGNDDALFNKNVVAESSSVSPEPITMVDDQGIELDSQNENLDFLDGEVSEPLNGDENGNVTRLDSLEEFPSLISCNSGKIISISDASIMSRTAHSCSFEVNNDDESSIVLKTEDVEDTGDQLDKATGCCKENLFQTENEQTGNCESKDTPVASSKGCSVDVLDGEKASIVAVTKPFNFLIKIPRSDDEILREQIRLARLHLDEKTKLRDAIQVQIQKKRANNQTGYEFAKGEVRSARKLVKSKHMEIDSLLSVVNKARNALSIEDINSQIRNMNYKMQHKTITLNEEKQLIREIKQLKQLREQLSSNMGSQDEIKQALKQREEAEDHLKILRKDLDILKNRVFKAEVTAAEAKKKYDDENLKVRELQAQCRAADGVRQAAYAQWQNLRKELLKKGKHFFKYKDDTAVANDYAISRDTEALYCLCMTQVENFMELWNTNEEYRSEYARFNVRSTVRRFGTLDGRALGRDEEPPLPPSYAHDRGNRMASTQLKVDLAPQIPNPELKQETTNENVTLDGKSVKKVTESKNQKVKKGLAVTVQVNGLDTLCGREFIDEVYEEPIKSKDEVESLRKEEELRREEAEAKLKEQRRLEEMAKANEAREKKKRQAEKLQISEELKAQKEAEQREKKREKRRRKKEKKNAARTDANDISNNCESAPSCESAVENSKDIEAKDMASVAPKKPKVLWWFEKRSKTKSIPPPLRNRNKEKLQQWMWVGITSFFILVLFLLQNVGAFSNLTLKQRSTFH